ncbi:DUF1499 domain-containing protein [Psychromonas sp. RZ22]|uniref:DUF1499 domain-containing protein n=1 Tax=Psychromonas algarum TaxID=2555643 RepID=UPI0010685EF2|nr:DUF1499 domain-containing protein [Psychromonas sp. RZ22]TEW55308.1 DUF1499 domain-containing protein [Psychromonas sp. RZ22]
MKKFNLSNSALIVALICITGAALMVFGSSLGLWEPIVGFAASRNYNNVLGYCTIIIAVIALFLALKNKQSKNTVKSLIALVLGLIILAPTMLSLITTPVRYPPIHDITSDTQNPPQFTFLTDSRAGAKNTLVYAGQEIAVQQLKAFPDIQPIISELAPDQAYLKAIKIAENMDWLIVNQDLNLLKFEATARTPFFNFADDVVVKITTQQNNSRIDIRSVSRIGRGDRGVNAKRIKEFTEQFNR